MGKVFIVDPSKYGLADCYEMARFWGVSVQEAVERMADWPFVTYDAYDGEELRQVPKDLREQVDQARFDGRLEWSTDARPTPGELLYDAHVGGIVYGDQDYSDL